MFEEYPTFHEIVRGDTLYRIARNYRTTVQDILNMNPHVNPYNLLIGEILNILPGRNTTNSFTPQPQNNSSMTLPNNCISTNELALNKNMRMFWSQHVYWTRLLIISIVDNLKDTDYATKRVLQTAVDIANLFSPYYGIEASNAIEELLTEHLVIAKDLITATKNKDNTTSDRLNKEWYANADQMVDAFNSINPSYYNKEEVRKMLYEHLDLTKEELTNRINKNYQEDVNSFNNVEQEVLRMADYFTNGIVKQFPNEFKN